MQSYQIGSNQAGQRLDKFLNKFMPDAGNGFLYKMLRKKNIVLNGKKAEGKEAYIKSDYLEASAEEIIVADNASEEGDGNEDSNSETAENVNVSGKVTVKENVRVRDAASEDGNKLGTVYVGDKLDFVEKMSNGWTKIKYNGKIAYVKSDYVE